MNISQGRLEWPEEARGWTIRGDCARATAAALAMAKMEGLWKDRLQVWGGFLVGTQ